MSRVDKPTLKCDRCGYQTESLSEMARFITRRHSHMSGTEEWDLCPPCNAAFRLFLDLTPRRQEPPMTSSDPTPGDPGAHSGPIPRYGMLDVWMALGRDSQSFDAWYDERGYAEAWAELMSALRAEQSARQAAERVRGHYQVQMDKAFEDCTAAEERERALIAGVKEANARYERSAYEEPSFSVATDMFIALAPLSHLLSSTPTEEGEPDE